MTEAEAKRLAEEEGLMLATTTKADSDADIGAGSQVGLSVGCPACAPFHRHVAHSCGRQKVSKRVNASTGYKGVAYHDKSSTFSAHISQGGTKRYIGSYTSAAEAALVYARAAASTTASPAASATQLVSAPDAGTEAEAEVPQPPQVQVRGKRVPKRKRVFESFESASPPEAPQSPLRLRVEAGPGTQQPLRCTFDAPCAACRGSAAKKATG